MLERPEHPPRAPRRAMPSVAGLVGQLSGSDEAGLLKALDGLGDKVSIRDAGLDLAGACFLSGRGPRRGGGGAAQRSAADHHKHRSPSQERGTGG